MRFCVSGDNHTTWLTIAFMTFVFLIFTALVSEHAFPHDVEFRAGVIKNFVQPDTLAHLKYYEKCGDRWGCLGTISETVSQVLSYVTPVLIFSGTYDEEYSKMFSFSAGFSSVCSIAASQLKKYSNKKALQNYKNRDCVGATLNIDLAPIPGGLSCSVKDGNAN